MQDIQQNTLAVQPPQQANVLGDDGVASIFFFEPQALPSGDLIIGTFNANFWSKAQGTKVFADGDHDVVVTQPDEFVFADLTIVTQSKAKSRASGSAGEAGFMIKIWPKVNAVPIGDSPQTATPSAFTHNLIANKSSVWPWGASVTDANEGSTAAAAWGPVWSENRIWLHTHVGNGSDTDITLSKTPAAESGAKVKAWKDGVELTYTTDYTVSGTTFTFVAAPAAGAITVVRYEYA